MLLLVAALGVDYGWQPDGVGGVEYVVQVQPDQWERVKELGEISSVIDPQVQGRVSKVIIRVGNSRLPRSAPPPRPLSANQTSSFNEVTGDASRPVASAFASNDMVPMPIPQMRDPRDASPIPAGTSGRGAVGAPSASVMKPADNSFALPSALQGVADSVNNAARGAAEQLKQDFTTNPQNQLDASVNQLRTANPQAASAYDQLTADPRAAQARGVSAPSTAPADYRPAPPVDPRSAYSAPEAANTRVQPPPFTGADASGMARTRSGGPSTEPASPQSKEWQALDARREAAAAAANAAGGGASSSFGNYARQPDSLRVDSNAATAPQYNQPTTNPNADPSAYSNPGNYTQANPNGAAKTDPRLTAAQLARLPDGAYSFNKEGVPVDENWVPFNPPTYPINPPSYSNNSPTYPNNPPSYSNVSAPSYPSSYGRPPAPAPSPSYAETLAERNARESQARDNEAIAAYERDRYARENAVRLAANSSDLSQRGAASSSDLSRNYPQGQDTGVSSSDRRGAQENGTRTGQNPLAFGGRNELAPQKFFNVMLLCSIVGNFYLFFWLKNMRDHFRDVVTAKRAAQSSASVA